MAIDKSKMKCNSPRRQVQGGKKFVVKACKGGKEKIIRFGDANMTIKKNIPARRKSFRARHRCETAKDVFSVLDIGLARNGKKDYKIHSEN
jgi:hypothetical protein